MRWFKNLFIFKAFILNKTGYKAQLEQKMRHFRRISYVGTLMGDRGMFSGLLEAVESHCPDTDTKLTAEQHKELLDEVLPWLSVDAEPLLGAARAIFGEDIFESSEIGFEYMAPKPDQDGLIYMPIQVCSMYVRPAKDCRSVSLNFTVLRGFTSRRQVHRPSVEIELETWDLEAKDAFESLYKDYRGQITRLLEHGQIKFFTSYCSDIVGKSKSNKLSVKLDEYFTDPEVDNCFSLSKSCPSGTNHSTAIRGFLVLSVLYIACCAWLAGKSGRSLLEKNLARVA